MTAIAPLIFRQEDAPRYVLGCTSLLPLTLHEAVLDAFVDTIEIMLTCLGILALCLAVLIYPRVNALRAKRHLEMGTQEEVLSVDEIRSMGDRAPDFRYTL